MCRNDFIHYCKVRCMSNIITKWPMRNTAISWNIFSEFDHKIAQTNVTSRWRRLIGVSATALISYWCTFFVEIIKAEFISYVHCGWPTMCPETRLFYFVWEMPRWPYKQRPKKHKFEKKRTVTFPNRLKRATKSKRCSIKYTLKVPQMKSKRKWHKMVSSNDYHWTLTDRHKAMSTFVDSWPKYASS